MRWLLTAASAWFSAALGVQEITLSAERVEGPSFSATGVKGALRPADAASLDLQAAQVEIAGKDWRHVSVRCPELKQQRDQLLCAQGVLQAPAKWPFALSYSSLSKVLDVVSRPTAGESWRLTFEALAPSPALTLVVENGLLTRFTPWLPPGAPVVSSGTASGKLAYSDNGNGSTAANAELSIANLGFSDSSGLHAGEKISAQIELQAQQRGAQWQWQSRGTWKGGDILWQPLFLSGAGQVLAANGSMDAIRISVERAKISLPGIADIDTTAVLDRNPVRVRSARISSPDVAIAALYDQLLKSALQGTVLSDLRAEGRADIALEVRDGAVEAIDLALHKVSVEDRARRYGLFGLTGSLPWRRNQLTSTLLQLEGGEILKVPFGAFAMPLEMRGMQVRMREAAVPLFDGKLVVKDFSSDGSGDSWRWRFNGGIAPISMGRLTTAAGLPTMHGALSAEIPVVSYEKSTLSVGGALLFKVFDGTVVVQKLVLQDAFDRVPRLSADIDVRNLDLDLLTRTFSFGNITGRIDAHIGGLELIDWTPARFDAHIVSSAGTYPKRISQAAVQNISALGGAGAAAAIQRSFLSFFETFGYSQLGINCRLENGVCHMGGIADVPQGYVLVKGGGIPAVNVLGYNRSVGWRELVDRLKRITDGNVVVK